MSNEHPKITSLSRLDLQDIDRPATLFSNGFVWHSVNRNLPELDGVSVGLDGLKHVFDLLGDRMNGTFQVEPLAAVPFGEEFVVVHIRDTMVHDGRVITTAH